MQRRHFLKFTTGAALSSALAACGGGGPSGPSGNPLPPPEPARTRVVVGWNKVALAAIRAARAAPPMAARALGIVHTAMYDAWAAYDKVALGTRLGASMRRPLAEQVPANALRAISFAAYAALADQFPAQKAAFDAHMALLGYQPAEAAGDPALPAGVGAIAARAVLAHAHADGSNQLGTLTASGVAFADYSGYLLRNPPLVLAEPTPRSAIPYPGNWQPLTFRDAGGVARTPAYLAPFWGQVRPFALRSGARPRPLRSAAPPSSSRPGTWSRSRPR